MIIVVDMNLSTEWSSFLRERGHEAAHWSTLGQATAEDGEIIDYCLNHKAVILSGDLDFATYHALSGTSKPSVVQLRGRDLLPAALGHSVARALTIGSQHLASGAIITIKSARMRITRLPFVGMDTN